jgi:hypothetical protein
MSKQVHDRQILHDYLFDIIVQIHELYTVVNSHHMPIGQSQSSSIVFGHHVHKTNICNKLELHVITNIKYCTHCTNWHELSIVPQGHELQNDEGR